MFCRFFSHFHDMAGSFFICRRSPCSYESHQVAYLETPLAEMSARFLKGRHFRLCSKNKQKTFKKKKSRGWGKDTRAKEKCRRHNATLRRPRCTQPSMVANVLAIVPTDARFKRATPPNHFHPQQRLWEGLESRTIVSLARPACLRASRALADTLQMHGGLAVSHATKRMVSNADQRGMDAHCFSTWGIPPVSRGILPALRP